MIGEFYAKPLYQKTITYSATGKAVWVNVADLTDLNIDHTVSINGILHWPTPPYYILSYNWNFGSNYISGLTVQKEGGKTYLADYTSAAYAGFAAWARILYTKTTAAQ